MGYRVWTHKWSILSFFITCCAGSSSAPKQYLVSLRSWKKNILVIHSKKIIIPAPFHSKAFALLHKFETSRVLIGRLSRGIFLPSQGPLILNILKNFSWPFYLACYLCEIELPCREIRAMKYKTFKAEKYTRARAPLAQTCTNRIFETNNGTTRMKIVNYIERHNFCWNDLLTKSNRTEIQTYKLEERTFGTPCAAVEGLTQAILSFFFFN